jgi:S1-C subfamily serine protease
VAWRRGLAEVACGVGLAGALVVVPASSTMPADVDFAPVAGPAAVRLLRHNTVRIVRLGCGLVSDNGSGVLVASGQVVTNRHVVEGALNLNVIPEDGPTGVGFGLVNPNVDVAVVRASPAPPGDGLTLARRDPRAGTDVLVAGFPFGDNLRIARARVVDSLEGASRSQAGPVVRLRARLSPGMSGGPVLDQSGHLAGIVFGIERSTGYGLAIPASTLRAVLSPAAMTVTPRCTITPG